MVATESSLFLGTSMNRIMMYSHLQEPSAYVKSVYTKKFGPITSITVGDGMLVASEDEAIYIWNELDPSRLLGHLTSDSDFGHVTQILVKDGSLFASY